MLLAVRLAQFDGNELSGNEVEFIDAFDHKLQVLGRVR